MESQVVSYFRSNSHFDIFATDLHGLLRIFTKGTVAPGNLFQIDGFEEDDKRFLVVKTRVLLIPAGIFL